MRSPKSTADPDHILLRGVNWLGDAIMTMPALQRLRERYPRAKVTLLGPRKLVDLYAHQAHISAVVSPPGGGSLWATAKLVRQLSPDMAIIFPNSLRTALEAWLGGVPVRIGRAGKWRTWALTHPVAPRPGRVQMRKRTMQEIRHLIRHNVPRSTFPTSSHHLLDYLELVGVAGADPTPCAPRLTVNEAETRTAKKKFGVTGNPGRAVVGMNPGAEYGPAKRWPMERFAEVAEAIQGRADFLLFGGHADAPLATELSDRIRNKGGTCRSLAGQTTLRELCALLPCCHVLLTNDTGPMHVAAALGVRVVVPFGSTSPELTGPGLPDAHEHRLVLGQAPCAPCFRRECPVDFRCMLSIDSGRVIPEILGMISSGPSK